MGVVLSPTELVAHLQHSRLPTVLVEGKDDMIIYRNLQRKNYELLACGARNTLFEVFKQSKNIQIPLAFIADKDTFVYLGVNPIYQDIVFTTGYCVENDLYEDMQNMLADLLDEPERQLFNTFLDAAAAYCAFELNKLKANNNYAPFYGINFKSSETVDDEGNFTPKFVQKYNFIVPAAAYIEALKENNYRNVRGKYIFEIFERLMQIRKKANKSKEAVFFSKMQLIDLAFRREKILDNSNGKIALIQSELLKKIK